MYHTKALADGSTLVDFGEGFRRIEFDASTYDARVSLPRVARFKSLFDAASKESGVPSAWLAAIAYHETRGDETTSLPAGGRGLMAITNSTAASLGVDPMNPREAILGAAHYLRPLWLAGRSVTEAASGYTKGYSLKTAEPHRDGNLATWGLRGAPSYLEGVTRLANSLIANPALLPDVEPFDGPPAATETPESAAVASEASAGGTGLLVALVAVVGGLLLRARSR